MKSSASSPGRLAVPVAVLALVTGCDRGSSSPGHGSGGSNSAKVSTPTLSGTSPSKSTTKIEGDRLADLAPVVPNQGVPQDPSPFRFTEIAREAGIDFVQVSGMEAATKHFPTANGSGVALFDYDGDGKLDIYFATGTYFPVGSRKTGSNKLYKNLGGGKFKDVTKESGLGFEGYCHGIIAGDIDNDGDAD
ncbi:MAG TPA: VCBS repeat-containing protein, partial [Isosphaeraceae bacterium]